MHLMNTGGQKPFVSQTDNTTTSLFGAKQIYSGQDDEIGLKGMK